MPVTDGISRPHKREGLSNMDNIPDFIKMFSEQMGGDSSKIESLLNMAMSSQNATNTSDCNSSSSSQSFEMPDMETIMKIKKIMDAINSSSNDPSTKLLLSLKPYLREEKKNKVDNYIKLLSIGKVMSNFSDFGGDSK